MNISAPEKRPERYDHSHHAGNAADVFKHVALILLADALKPNTVVETHAGSGRYHLGPHGEWARGIGRLLQVVDDTCPAAVARYLALVDARPSKKGVRYLGSPVLVSRAHPSAKLILFEIVDDVAAALRSAVPDADVRVANGLAAISSAREMQSFDVGRDTLIVVDPPYADKAEWGLVADAVVAAARSDERTIFLWYPVKSHTRPNALIARLKGIPGIVVEASPHQGKLSSGTLVGSGVIVVRPPPQFSDDVIAACGWLTPRLSTGAWSLRARSL